MSSKPSTMTQTFPTGSLGEAPIYTVEEFAELRGGVGGKIVATSGGFDPIHPGHTSCIITSKDFIEQETGERPDHLVVIVNGVGFLRNKKGAEFQDLMTRARVVACLRGVDAVVTYESEEDMTVTGAIHAIKPHFFTKGGDRTDPTNIAEWDLCVELGCKVVTGVGVDKDWSSSDLLGRWSDLARRGVVK